MATNTLRPSNTPRRANVPREVPAPEPEVLPEPVVAEVPEPAPEPAPARETKPRKPKKEPRPRSSWSLFSLLDRVTSVDGLFREGLPVRFLPHLLFVMLLTLLYIGNTHYGNRMNRNIHRLKQETEDLRADYTTLKSDYMEASKQSEVARKVAAFGLVESSSPPFRISVPAGRLDAAELELMPVLTADTLAARAARDSAAALQSDIAAGRRREATLGEEDSGPEIIAPLQSLDGDTTAAGAPAEPARRAAPTTNSKTPKGASRPKAKTTDKQDARAKSR
ncbi:hypothetical protein I2I05_10885 [Hymenobacter sp. BT683]|uniref:Cell division protein FtsL n=1 Tax=Hymenobacter jeongseonensis TaxID=2791027 RepID=A0ABS0IHQ8_9BACT|nr:FtsL-like putative cell division protein [Hymenobacter jeongseonensis]MBF9237899.1 hypothetical protein [Hymenobacter jeongseonensis]